jgi:RecA/RadA recombinase
MSKLYKVFQDNYKASRKFVEYTPDFYFNNYKKRDIEMYESIYLYTDEHIKYFKANKNSLAGITDNFTDKMVFDFDSKSDKQKALLDARTLVSRLLTFIDPHAIRCFFSGNKGYHVEVHFDETITRANFEAILNEYTPGLKTFDVKIKDEQRLFRFPLSRNKETKLYKIPMLVDVFLDYKITHEQIEEVAANPNWEEIQEVIGQFSVIQIPTQFLAVINKAELSQEEILETAVDDGPDMSLRPRFLNPAKYVLSMGYFEEGERNEACMILAATYRYLNFSKNQAYGMIKIALQHRATRLGLKYDQDTKRVLWNEIIEKVFADTWKGHTYSDLTNPLLVLTIEKYNLGNYYNSNASKNVVSVSEIANNFVNFANNVDNNIIKTGIKELDNDLMLTSSMMVGILGSPSSGKTSLSLTIAEHQSLAGINTFFVSADMGDKLFYARIMQKYCGLSFRKILEEIKGKKYEMWSKKVKDAFDQANENFKNVGMAFNSGPSLINIREGVEQFEQDTGKPVKALFIDYLEKMRCDYSDANASSAFNASRTADLTRDKDMTTFLLLQTQKHAGDPSDELTSMRRVKGSSVIEQDSRVILSTWRPGFNPDVKGENPDDKFACIAVVKNNMGVTGRYDLGFDGATGLYTSLNEEQLEHLDQVKIRSANRKAAKAAGTYGSGPPSAPRKPFVPASKLTNPTVDGNIKGQPKKELF